MNVKCHASTIEEDRKDSANTHFEEWWFKTLLRKVTANVALKMIIDKPVLIGAGFFVCSR